MSAITIMCGSGGPNYSWAGIDAEAGIGGSEECVILLARALANQGHKVVVYNQCAGKVGFHMGVEYRNYVFADKMETPDVLIAWRNWYHIKERKAAKQFLWCHDIPCGCHCPAPDEVANGALENIDKIVVLNDYHKGLYMNYGIPEDKLAVVRIGAPQEIYNVAQAAPVERDLARVLYFSHPDRGLPKLREYWPEIRRQVPEATLASFWWEPSKFLPANESIGILPMRILNYNQVAAETLRAGIFGYPSVFAPEISPATTIKAQMGGAYPVVVIAGGMDETVRYGVRTTHEHYIEAMVNALRQSLAGELEEERVQMQRWAREVYSWPTSAEEWSKLWE